MWIWTEARERWLFSAAIVAFLLVCLVNVRLPLWQALEGGALAVFLCADATSSVTSDLLIGLISAYVFYVIIELLPSHRKRTETLKVLNLLVASIVDAFERASIFGHETSISSIDINLLSISSLQSDIEILESEPDYLQLKFSMETGHSRYQDFQHALSLAVGLSPEHALDWLVLTDKVRLLAQEYEAQPIDPLADLANRLDDPAVIAGHLDYVREFNLFEGTLTLRVKSFFQAAILWMERQR